jgi:hypothetical protein
MWLMVLTYNLAVFRLVWQLFYRAGLIGFVLGAGEGGCITISICRTKTYGHLGPSQIGFVFSGGANS